MTGHAHDAERVALGCPDWCSLDVDAHELGVQTRDGRTLLAVDHGHDPGGPAYLTSTAWLVPDGSGGLRVEVEPVSLVVEVERLALDVPEQVRVLAEQLLAAADALAQAQGVEPLDAYRGRVLAEAELEQRIVKLTGPQSVLTPGAQGVTL